MLRRRFHPKLLQTLLQPIKAREGFKLLDPFMGGGTTLVEGMCQGFEVVGNDLNAMAGLVTRERCRLRTLSENREVLTLAKQLRERIIDRQDKSQKKLVRRANISWLRSHYAPHLFVELLYWIDEIDKLPPSPIEETLRMVFCDLVFKFSNEALPPDASLESRFAFFVAPTLGVSGSPGWSGMSMTLPRWTPFSFRKGPSGITSPRK